MGSQNSTLARRNTKAEHSPWHLSTNREQWLLHERQTSQEDQHPRLQNEIGFLWARLEVPCLELKTTAFDYSREIQEADVAGTEWFELVVSLRRRLELDPTSLEEVIEPDSTGTMLHPPSPIPMPQEIADICRFYHRANLAFRESAFKLSRKKPYRHLAQYVSTYQERYLGAGKTVYDIASLSAYHKIAETLAKYPNFPIHKKALVELLKETCGRALVDNWHGSLPQANHSTSSRRQDRHVEITRNAARTICVLIRGLPDAERKASFKTAWDEALDGLYFYAGRAAAAKAQLNRKKDGIAEQKSLGKKYVKTQRAVIWAVCSSFLLEACGSSSA
ncbi:hypothetical protein LTR97_000395 [Elasticomyces elasticus]|uniref:Uncharacterized protein n=1 Tax=Elasticomyces elasticus TaxID=574655 RepID=A0AAN7WIV7_9PEZI|nr:hypothetical protein LTR97_000395 [Elasticomyces elasticus]